MAYNLEDLISSPTNPDDLERHLVSRGLVAPAPPPPPVMPTITGAAPPPSPNIAPMTAPVDPARGTPIMPSPPPGLAPMTKPAPPPAEALPSNNITFSPEARAGLKEAAPFQFGGFSGAGAPTGVPGATAGALPAAPEIGAAAPPAEAGAGGVAVKPMAPLVMPTKKESEAAGRAEYFAGRPQVTADKGTDEYDKQKLAQMSYDERHPLGADISAKPGFGGKVLHTLGRIGDVALAAVAPNVSALVPGAMINRLGTERGLQQELQARQAHESSMETAGVQRRNIESEIANRGEHEQALEKDEAGNVIGWRDSKGVLKSLDDAQTPQGIKDIAETAQTRPKYEQDKVTGDIVRIATDKDGNVKSEVVYKGTPNVKTETKEVLGADGKAHQKVFDVTPGSPKFGQEIADLGRAKEEKTATPAQELAKMKHGEEYVRGFDDQGREHLVTRDQADEMKLKHIGKAEGTAWKDGTQNGAALNDMGAKSRNMITSLKALDQGPYQTTLIQEALKSDPDSWASRIAISQMSEASKQYVQDVRSLREAALALPKQTTGGSRVSETQAQALWATIPAAAGDSKYAMSQMQKFDENLQRLWKKVPLMEGQDREMSFGGAAGGGAAPAGGGTVKIGGKEVKLDPDGTFMQGGHQYRPIPGTKKAELVK